MNNIISISGGKDSTAVLIEMTKRGENIHSAVFFDTGWEFPAMYDHIVKLENYTGVKIWRLHPVLPFDYWLTARPIIARKGPDKGKVHRIGNGWPSMSRRWCTRLKVDAIKKYSKPIENDTQCIGYAADEKNRSLNNKNMNHRFPLQEYGITEKTALKICYDAGFHWDGLYEHFRRVSCFCCPLQRIGELRILRREYPELWDRMLIMDKSILNNCGFRGYNTVQDLEKRFVRETKPRGFLKYL